MPFDDTGFVHDRRPDRTPPGEPVSSIGLAELAFTASACLLAWGLAFAVVGIGMGVLTIFGVL